MPALVLMRDGREVQVIDLGAAVHFGRAPTNAIVLLDESVSAHHVVIWAEGAEVWVEDLGSANGTWVDQARIEGPVRVPIGAQIRVFRGADPTLMVREVASATGIACWMVEDRTAGVRVPIRTDRFWIGSGAGANLQLPSGPDRAATLMVTGSEVWLGEGDDDRILAPGEPFRVQDHELALVAPAKGRVATVHIDPDRYDYRVTATLDGTQGPEARVEHRRERFAWQTSDDNRAVLLYLLARQLDHDRGQAGLPPDAVGWVEDEALISGVWGKQRPVDEVNSLNVLIHRIRRGVRRSGLDPWFIEKHRRSVRMRVTEVRVA